MTKKQEHVPEMREVKPNREQRRHPEGKPDDQPLVRDEPAPETPDLPAPRSENGSPRN